MISVSRLAASVLFETLKESGVQTGQSLRLVKIEKGLFGRMQWDIQENKEITKNLQLLA